MRYRVWTAYLLWFFGGLGTLGFQRFYLGKVPTGVLWLFTGGCGFFGAVYDFFTLGAQVAEANGQNLIGGTVILDRPVSMPREKEPLERAILRVAEKNEGRVTAVQVAASSDWTIDQAAEQLERLAKRGQCQMRVSKEGTVVYRFAEFDPANREFEV